MGAARQAASRGEREWRGGATSIPGCEMLFRVDEVWGLVWGGAHCQPSVRSDDQVVGHGTGLCREGERRRQRGVGWLRAPPCGAVGWVGPACLAGGAGAAGGTRRPRCIAASHEVHPPRRGVGG